MLLCTLPGNSSKSLRAALIHEMSRTSLMSDVGIFANLWQALSSGSLVILSNVEDSEQSANPRYAVGVGGAQWTECNILRARSPSICHSNSRTINPANGGQVLT